MIGKYQQLNSNPEKEKDIAQPVEEPQVAAARPKKQKRSSTNSFEANSDAEAQLLVQQQQTLNLTKQKSPSKNTEGRDTPNHSTGDQSPTGDILSQIDLEEDVDCQTGPKSS